MSMMRWKDIPTFDGSYQVSDTGEVKSVDRTIIRKNGYPLHFKEKFKMKQVCRKGYHRVQLSVPGKKKNFRVHRLVALAFIPNPKKLKTVNHINGNKLDNRVENLEWLSSEDNVSESFRTGKRNDSINKSIKLTKEHVEDIKAIKNEGVLEKDICDKYDIHRSTITRVMSGSYRHRI